MEALRRLQREDPRKLYRLARQRDVTQAMAFEALKADVGRQVQAPRPTGCRSTSSTSARTRGGTKYGLVVMDVFTREAAVEPLQNNNAETVAAPPPKMPDRGIQTLKTWPRGWRARAGSGATTSSGRPGPTTRGPTRPTRTSPSGGAFRAPTNAARKLQPSVRRRAAVDSMTVRSTEGRETPC